MVRQKFPCKNHPEKPSAKRCYVCKDYICSTCQNKWSHHFFCSYFCYLKYQLIGYANFIKSNFKIILFILLTQLITIVFIIQLTPDAKPDIEISSTIDQSIAMVEDSSSTFTVDTLSVPHADQMMFSGETSSNSLLGLWHNGKIIHSIISNNKNYKFEPVSLFMGKNIFKVVKVDSVGKNVLIDSVNIDYTSSRILQLMKSVSKVRTDEKVFSLTFDGGSITTGADSILKILEANNIQTTFFLTGKFIIRYPELTQKILNTGHEIGNHSYSHPHLTQFEESFMHELLDGVNRVFVQKELLKTDSVFYAKFQQNMMKFWRAPFGEYNKEILQWGAEIGYRHIRWSKNGDLADWVKDSESALYKTADEMYQQIVDLEKNDKLKGSIILMHLGTDRKNNLPYKMLPGLIKHLHESNYKFVKISDLLSLQITS
jgi:peptidoglycan/xylan/chitin deacetylase (PgdA/CDA1 family)